MAFTGTFDFHGKKKTLSRGGGGALNPIQCHLYRCGGVPLNPIYRGTGGLLNTELVFSGTLFYRVGGTQPVFFYLKGKGVSFNPKIFVYRGRGGSQPENFLNPKLLGGVVMSV